MFCLSQIVSAQTVNNADTRDVEIGAGGNIKLENPYRTVLEEKAEWHAHLLLESRYVTEGRDNFSGDGIYSVSTEFTYKDISFVPWIADGIGQDYHEINLNFVYGIVLLDNLEIFTGYTYLQSRESGSNAGDNEISLDLAYFYNKQLQLLASIYYSTDANGSFSEIAIKKHYLVNEGLSINIYAIIGFNAGYVTDGHNGINHGQLRTNLSYQVDKHMDVYAYAGYSSAINRDSNRYAGDELLRDFFWGGLGLSYRF